MGIARAVVRQSIFILLPLTLLSFLLPKAEALPFLKLFGNPGHFPASVLIGGLLGLANVNCLIWSVERLLGTQRADTRLLFASMFRLFILFGIIILLVALKLVNLLGLVIGMTVVFVILIKEGLKAARRQTIGNDQENDSA